MPHDIELLREPSGINSLSLNRTAQHQHKRENPFGHCVTPLLFIPKQIGTAGLEPAISSSQNWRDTNFPTPREPTQGIEPRARCLQNSSSATELNRLDWGAFHSPACN